MEIKFTNTLFYPRKAILKCIMKTFILLFCTSVFSLTSTTILSQDAKISIDQNKVLSIDQVFDLIRTQTQYTFIYQEDMFKNAPKVTLEKGVITANKLLELSLGNNNYEVILTGTNEIIIKKKKQQSVVTGQVKDENGMPLGGVTVLVKGSANGVATDIDGRYSIKASKGEVLKFSYVGMMPVEIPVGDDLIINIVLTVDSESLEEVVLVGYGSQKRSDITGSVTKVNVAEMNKTNPISVDNALVGRASGVHVVTASGAPGSNASIRIRGITSVFGNNEPLYVIDGLPMEIGQGQGNDFYAQNFSSTLSPLSSINPMDIESIDILKDASATAIYGSRGANGVVIITTKKGSYSSVPNISLSSTTSISSFTNDYSMLDANQYHSVVEEAYGNAGATIPNDDELYPFGREVNTNWQEQTDQTAINTNYYLNANGGSLNGSSLYSLSAGVTDQKGVIYGTNYKRNNLRAKLETSLSDKLRVGVNFNYSDSNNKGSNTTFYYQIIKYRPDIPIFEEDGSYANDPANFQSNPYAKVRYPSYVDSKNLILSLFAEYELTKGLQFKSTYSYTKGDNESFRYTPSYDPFELRNNRKGTLNQSNSGYSSRIWDNTLTFSKSFNRHDINTVAGVSFTENSSEYTSIRATDFPDDDVMVTPGAASSLNLTSGGTISGLASYFLRANYNFDNKYYLTFTGRADNSTKFGPKNQWGYFPSGAIAWRISKEKFFNVDFIDDLKLRTSYGKTGSANFSDFQYATFFEAGSYYNNNNGVISNTIPNPDIKWETTDQLDIALDFSMWDRRINGSVGYFNKNTSDQILLRDVILETGGTSQYSNIGDFLNKGFEFQIGVDVIATERFQWTSEFNMTTIKSKVLKLNGGYYRNLIEGESISYFEGYRVAKIFQNQEEIDALNAASPNGVYQSNNTAPGDFMYVDVNNDGYIGGDDRDIIGNAEPDFFGGFNNIFRFGNFEVSALFNYSVGNYLYNSNKKDLLIFSNYNNNYSKEILGAWTSQNPNVDIPRLVSGDPNNNRRDSDFFIEDASFIKLKNLNITYKFNPDILKKLFIQRASVSLSASNVFVITKYSGLDPEVNYNAASNFSQGYDSASYPSVRTFTLGLNLNL
ncbi:SusC/RagA family TonB-linked outer membrane protein [Gelidibacter maritimus]|uniref:TonB-dependent receptor n=1 Tax=Gelidibacter maritimus TaxID=2761487 RepID=A0A7W2M545_9FLAO|nr:TonB-dependent receptor [Gelidibacter maritimus]MBA6152903.1 TonB-dependent receptor [Gelidibacter maritimus]